VYLTILQSYYRLGKQGLGAVHSVILRSLPCHEHLSNKQGRKASSKLFRPSHYSCLSLGSYIQGNYRASITEASNGKVGGQTRLSCLSNAFGAQLFPAGFLIPSPFSTEKNEQEAVKRLATH